MKINAKSKNNYKTIKNYTRTMVFRKTNPLKKMLIFCLIAVVLAAVLILEMYLLGAHAVPIVLLIIAILMLLFELFLYFGLPRIRYHELAELKGCTNEYVFTSDSIRITAYDNGYSGEERIDYTVLRRAIETSKYLYLFQNKGKVYIVDKSSITGGTTEALQEKIRSVLDDRYVKYNY